MEDKKKQQLRKMQQDKQRQLEEAKEQKVMNREQQRL